MAIQNRRGPYNQFDTSKMLPGEWAVVTSGDNNSVDGTSVYMCFAAGNVKRMATYEDMVQNMEQAAGDLIDAAIVECKTAATNANNAANKTMAAVVQAQNAAAEAVLATDKANTAATAADDAVSAAEQATTRANTAATAADDAVSAAEQATTRANTAAADAEKAAAIAVLGGIQTIEVRLNSGGWETIGLSSAGTLYCQTIPKDDIVGIVEGAYYAAFATLNTTISNDVIYTAPGFISCNFILTPAQLDSDFIRIYTDKPDAGRFDILVHVFRIS